MPCRSETQEETIVGLSSELALVRAIACGVFRVLRRQGTVDGVLAAFDYREAGVAPKELEKWLVEHEEADEERRKRESRERNHQRKKRAALAKLTPEERELLGLLGDEANV